MKSARIVPVLLFILAGCQTAPHKSTSAPTTRIDDVASIQGRYDNREQVEQARAKADAQNLPPPRVEFVIESTQQPDWALWRVHVDTPSGGVDVVWAMHKESQADGSIALVPYTLRHAVDLPNVHANTFDAQQWFALEACALRGEFSSAHFAAYAEGPACVVVATGIGPQHALLPAAIERDGARLQILLMYTGQGLRVELMRHDVAI